MVAKVETSKWDTIDGVFCLIVSGKDERGNEQKVAVPAAALPTIAGESRRRSMATQMQAQRQIVGPWQSALMLPVQTWNVGATDSGSVGIILDRGMDTEVQYHMPVDHARGVAELLVEEATKAESYKPARN